MKKKIISAVLAFSTLLSGISAFAQYPEATVKSDGTVVYGPWGENEQPKASITSYGSPDNLFGYKNTTSDGQSYSQKWITSGSLNAYSDSDKVFQITENDTTLTFVLLDTDADGNYFVVADDKYGDKSYSFVGRDSDDEHKAMAYGTWVYDANNEKSIAYWLNHDFLTNGNGGKKLPTEIVNNLVEKDWGVEGASSTGDTFFYTKYGLTESMYTSVPASVTKQKVSLLSATEVHTYWEYLSPLMRDYTFQQIKDNTGWSYAAWGLRTPRNNDTFSKEGSHFGHLYIQCAGTSGGKWGGNNFYNGVGVRPCFFLNKDFFSKVAVDTTNLGSDVIAEIKSKYAKSELSDLYDNDTLTSVFGYSQYAPLEAKNVNIKGSVAVGETLTVQYDYEYESGTTAVAEGNTKIQWYASADGVNYEPIEGATGKTYTVTADDADKYFKVSVKCADENGNLAGTVLTGGTTAVRTEQAVKATGTVSKSGDTVNASYTFTTPQSQTFTLIIGIYDANNKMLGVKNETKTVANGESITASLDFGTGVKAKVFAIDANNKPYFMEEVAK